jgi:hypothetical protein
MMWQAMSQYEQENARFKVEGYMIGRQRLERAEQEFDRAKAECIKNLTVQIAQIECMTFADFPKKKWFTKSAAQFADAQTHE